MDKDMFMRYLEVLDIYMRVDESIFTGEISQSWEGKK
jgi:hypothetical protein